MNRKTLISICFLLVSVLSHAQFRVTEECHVKENDLTATKQNDTDPIEKNGKNVPFAIVLVGLAEEGITFEHPYLLKTKFIDNEYWLYFADGVKNMTVKSKKYPPLHYNFPQRLKARTTYVMSISQPQGELEIKSNVAAASLYIDGIKVSDGAPYTYTGNGGTHTLEVKAPGYTTQRREVEIPVGQRGSVTVNLFAEGSLHVSGVSYGLVTVSATSFKMGSTDHYYEQPIRQISLMPFSIGSMLVSVELWKSIMGEVEDRICGVDGQVVNVTYSECLDFINALNAKTGKSYRLPTEAEWEYCARNAQKLGIADMKSCMEWCGDWFGKYQQTSDASPKGPESGVLRVVRGGSGDESLNGSSHSFRWYMHPDQSTPRVSFRLVCDD